MNDDKRTAILEEFQIRMVTKQRKKSKKEFTTMKRTIRI